MGGGKIPLITGLGAKRRINCEETAAGGAGFIMYLA